MVIILAFVLVPLFVGLLVEYAACRLPKRRAWRALPPVVLLAAAATVTVARSVGWTRTGEGAPLDTLLLFPGLSTLGGLLGLWLGWRLWKWLWTPQIWRRG